MVAFHDVELEIVRPGPPHNQLLSPLTQYMALCGAGSPTTFRIALEHRQLLNRLERLRYVTASREGHEPVPNVFRQAEVGDLGRDIGAVLSSIPSLNAELSKAAGRAYESKSEMGDYVHLRLVLSGSELAIMPFELAVAPQSYPGEGLEFVLQGSVPIVLTREIRRSRPLPTRLDKLGPPKILFVYAEPGGGTVPYMDHLAALVKAIHPWQTRPLPGEVVSDAQRLERMKQHIRVLSDATIEAIYDACASDTFTHVHILAHGATMRIAGEDRYGLALARPGNPQDVDVVSGERLAKALGAENGNGAVRSQPFMVTLASCDAGQAGSVLVPGGSIAHDLHTHGVPWVMASQFPLLRSGSVRMVGELYPRLLRGDDPRQVLYELRRIMYAESTGDHDWASIVAYATVPPDFDRQVAAFLDKQTQREIDAQLDFLDRYHENNEPGCPEDGRAVLRAANDEVEMALNRWQSRLPARAATTLDRVHRANCFGIKGSAYKRLSLQYQRHGMLEDAQRHLRASMSAYRQAMDEWATEECNFAWTASQYLSISAVLGGMIDVGTLAICRRFAERDLDSVDASTRAWSHATLAELELLSTWCTGNGAPPADLEEITGRVQTHCRTIVNLMGPVAFEVTSTCRQFKRYRDGWEGITKVPDHCAEIVAIAIEALANGLDGA